MTRNIVAQPAFAKFQPEEFKPGPDYGADDTELARAAGDVGTTIFHPVGTAKMGDDAMAVVNDRLQVHGVEGLRVVDASDQSDDTVAIRQAMAAAADWADANTPEVATIYFPAGTYAVAPRETDPGWSKNKPATFQHPGKSFLCDWIMIFKVLTFQIGKDLAKLDAPGEAAAAKDD